MAAFMHIFYLVFAIIFMLNFVSNVNGDDYRVEDYAPGENREPPSISSTDAPLSSKLNVDEFTAAYIAPPEYGRVNNIILYGITTAELSKYKSLFSYVFYLLNEVCGVPMEPTDIIAIRELKKRDAPDLPGKLYPTLVTLRTTELKSKLIHRRRLLSTARVKLEHDLPPEVYRLQNEVLKPRMKEHRQLGAYAVIRNGKLIVNGLVVTQIPVPKEFTYDSQSEERYNAMVQKKLQEREMTRKEYTEAGGMDYDVTAGYKEEPAK